MTIDTKDISRGAHAVINFTKNDPSKVRFILDVATGLGIVFTGTAYIGSCIMRAKGY